MFLSFNTSLLCNKCKSNFEIEAIYFLDKSTIKCPNCGEVLSEEHTRLLLEGIRKLQEFKRLTINSKIKIDNLDFHF